MADAEKGTTETTTDAGSQSENTAGGAGTTDKTTDQSKLVSVRKTLARKIRALEDEIAHLKAAPTTKPAAEAADETTDESLRAKLAKARAEAKAAAEAELKPRLDATTARLTKSEQRVLDAEVKSAALKLVDEANLPLVKSAIAGKVKLNDEGEVVVVDKDGDETDQSVDALIQSVVTKFPALAKVTTRAGGNFGGSAAKVDGDIDAQIAAAIKAGDYAQVDRLRSQKLNKKKQ